MKKALERCARLVVLSFEMAWHVTLFCPLIAHLWPLRSYWKGGIKLEELLSVSTATDKAAWRLQASSGEAAQVWVGPGPLLVRGSLSGSQYQQHQAPVLIAACLYMLFMCHCCRRRFVASESCVCFLCAS